jgi:hypothetical protein
VGPWGDCGPIVPGLYRMLYANFHEKAHFVKGRRGGPAVAECNGLCPSLRFHPHF